MGWGTRGLSVLVCGAFVLTPLALIAPAEAADPSPIDAEYTIDPAPTPDPRTEVRPQRSPSLTRSQAGLAIPALSSRPSSTHTIHLDFDGVTLGSTGFGSDWTPDIDPGTYTGFTLDASNDFSQAEVDQITTIWRIVAEKYAPYDVNVTTVDPGTAALRRSDASDATYGVKVVITDDETPKNQICSGSCAGVAYNDLFDGRQQNTGGGGGMTVFDTDKYALAWVFSSETFGAAQVTALDAAHEIGHTMGLEHDGGLLTSYYAGHAHWVPIMGITNQNAVSQFSKGEYGGANNSEDDLAIIATNGIAGTAGSFTLPDDFTTSGGAPTGAALLGDQTSYTVKGTITNAADDDLFSISRTCTNPLTVSANGIGAGQALDLKLDILDASNGVLASNNPASGQVWVDASNAFEPTGMNASATLPSTTAATTYRVRVDGVGHGNPLNTGYTDYGSIGTYTLTISGCSSDPGVPSVPGAPATVKATSSANGKGGTISWTAPTDNGGSTITGYRLTGLPTGTINLGSTLSYSATGLAPGRTYTVTVAAINATGTGAGRAATLRTATKPSAPRIGLATSGAKKGVKNATARWAAPVSNGGAAITSYKVVAYKFVKGKVVRSYVSRALGPSIRAVVFRLPGGRYKFRVVAYNAVGGSPASGYSRYVTSR